MLFCDFWKDIKRTYFPASQPYTDYPFFSYAKALELMDEPSFWKQSSDQSAHAFRFTCLPTFQNPIAIRVDAHKRGGGLLTTTILAGQGGFEMGEIEQQTQVRLEPNELAKVIADFEKNHFWDLLTLDPDAPLGLDGSEWLLEATWKGKYHAASRWSPDEGPVHDLGLMVLKMSSVDSREID